MPRGHWIAGQAHNDQQAARNNSLNCGGATQV